MKTQRRTSNTYNDQDVIMSDEIQSFWVKKFKQQSAHQFSNKAMHFELGAHDQGARGDGETRL